MRKGGFRPLLVKFDEERYNMDKTEMSQKVEYLLSIKEWILTYLEGVEIDLKKLTNDFEGYFEQLVTEKFLNENSFGLSARKLIELKEFPIYEYKALCKKYSENKAVIDISKEKAYYKINRKDYETYTTTDKENTILLLYKEWVLLDEKTRKIGLNPMRGAIQTASAGLVNVAYNGKPFINEEVLFPPK